jgi:type I restriction enzyme S subunit
LSNTLLGQIADIQAGPFGTQLHSSEYVESGIPMLNAKNIGHGVVLTDSLDFVSEATCKRLPRYILKEGDIVFGRAGSIERHTYISDKNDGSFQGTNCIRVRCKDKSLSQYISYYLWLPNIKKQISLSAGKTTLAYLNSDVLKMIPVKIVDSQLRDKIVNVFVTLDQKITLNSAINAELEKVAKTLYNYWFVQFDFLDDKGKPYRASGGKMEYNEVLKREIPEGWKVDKLNDKLNLQRGVEPGSDAYSEVQTETHIVPFIRVSDLGSEAALYISETAANGTQCKPTDVLVSFDGSIGKMGIAMKGAFSSGIRKIKGKNDEYSDALIYFIFQSNEIQKTIAKYAVGSNILHAAGAIEHLFFPCNEDVVNVYIEKVEPIYQMIVKNYLQNKELIELRDFLLPLLMNGQVSVSKEITDEDNDNKLPNDKGKKKGNL